LPVGSYTIEKYGIRKLISFLLNCQAFIQRDVLLRIKI
jgi:hypothetical protein